MSYQRHADWHEANIRIRRVCADAFVTYSPQAQLHQRWQAWEKMRIPLTLDDDALLKEENSAETEAVVCAAPTWGELLHMYGLIKSKQREEDAIREKGGNPGVSWRVLFRDRKLRGELSMPPPEPPEWAEYRAKMAGVAKQGGERMGEQIRATVRNFMALKGINARDLGVKHRRALGIGRLGDAWKGR